MKLGTWRAWRIGIVSLLWLVAVPLATIVAVGAWLQRQSASSPAADYLNALPLSALGVALLNLGWFVLWLLPPTMLTILWARDRRRRRRPPPP